MHNINDNTVQGRLSENYHKKYFRHKIVAINGIYVIHKKANIIIAMHTAITWNGA